MEEAEWGVHTNHGGLLLWLQWLQTGRSFLTAILLMLELMFYVDSLPLCCWVRCRLLGRATRCPAWRCWPRAAARRRPRAGTGWWTWPSAGTTSSSPHSKPSPSRLLVVKEGVIFNHGLYNPMKPATTHLAAYFCFIWFYTSKLSFTIYNLP